MSLSPAQLAALKTDVTNAPGAEFTAAIAAKNWSVIHTAYNALAPGPWIAWRNDVTKVEIIYAIVPSEWVLVTAQKQAGLNLYLDHLDIFDASQPNLQVAFQSIFGAGVTLTALGALGKRSATRSEKLFSTGTGSNGSPATVNATAVGRLSLDDVTLAFA